ncbi:putative quinol monooxygenase [Thermodesulfobacteriota bacterium]
MIIARIKLIAHSAKRKEVSLTLDALQKMIRRTKGCLDCRILISCDNENEFFLVEEWESRKLLDVHLQSELFAVLLGIRPLLRKSLQMNVDTIAKREKNEIVESVRAWASPLQDNNI